MNVNHLQELVASEPLLVEETVQTNSALQEHMGQSQESAVQFAKDITNKKRTLAPKSHTFDWKAMANEEAGDAKLIFF